MSGGGDQSGFTQLPGAGDAAAGIGLCNALVVDGLTVTADEVERVPLRGCLHGVAISLAEAPVETCKLGGRGIPSVLCGQHRSPQCCRVWKCAMANQLDARTRTR